MRFSTAFSSADILLPKTEDLTRWSVVACDQHTSEPEYWDGAEKFVGGAPSTLRLTLPEIYLESADVSERIAAVNRNIREYLAAGIFKEYKDAMIYVERTLSNGKIRRGIVGALDLEEYDYKKGSKSQIRATEATVAERIPPRLKIRSGAEIELPHIMTLIDDPEMTVIEQFAGKPLEKLYDFKLMAGGGSVKGYLIDKAGIEKVDAALAKLKEKAEPLFAIGDGNHSLAAAKEHYEQLKRDNPGKDLSNHPARYALCELVNLHSEALEFEAIHRIVKISEPYRFVMEMSLNLGLSGVPSSQKVKIHRNYTVRELYIRNPSSKLAVGSVQAFLDDYIAKNGGKIDYIHGGDVLARLSTEEGAIGFELEPMKKSELFPAIEADGALPRKTFSMGAAEDKRFYLEARKIVL